MNVALSRSRSRGARVQAAKRTSQCVTPRFDHAAEKRAPRILLRSSWQVVKIGNIEHTPGVMALIEKHIPEAEVRLWASTDLMEEVMTMEHRRFPELKIVKRTIGAGGKASNEDLAETIAWTDFHPHGSGPSLVAAKDVAAFSKYTSKPYGGEAEFVTDFHEL